MKMEEATMSDICWCCDDTHMNIDRSNNHGAYCQLSLKISTILPENGGEELIKELFKRLPNGGIKIGLPGDDEIVGIREGRFEEALAKEKNKREKLVEALKQIMEDD